LVSSTSNKVVKLLEDNMVNVEPKITSYITELETFEVLCELNERVNSIERSVKLLMEERHARR